MLPYSRNVVVDLLGLKIGTEPIIFLISYIVFFSILILNSKIPKKIDLFWYFAGITISANLFGRLFYFIFPWRDFSFFFQFFYKPVSYLTSTGAIFGAAIFTYFWFRYKKDKKLNFFNFSDMLAPAAIMMFFVLRIGCFVNGHLRTKVTDVPWCIYKFGACRHPVTLYLAIGALIIFIALKYIQNRKLFGVKFDGQVGLWFLVIYSFERVIFEFFMQIQNHVTQGMFLLSFLIFGVILLKRYIKH